MKLKKLRVYGVNWIIIFIVLILIANIIASVLLFNSYLYQKGLIEDIQNKFNNGDVPQNSINSLYLEFYRELSEKTDEAINRILTIIAIISGTVTIFSILLAFKAPKDIDRRIDEVIKELDTAREASEEAKYQTQIINALSQKKLNIIIGNNLSSVIEKYPRKPDAYLYRGYEKIERGQSDSAIKDFRLAKNMALRIPSILTL